MKFFATILTLLFTVRRDRLRLAFEREGEATQEGESMREETINHPETEKPQKPKPLQPNYAPETVAAAERLKFEPFDYTERS